MLKCCASKPMQPAHKTQIFSAGAGPVGLAAAIELRHRGFMSRFVDPDFEVSAQSRALAINPRTTDHLEPCGATETRPPRPETGFHNLSAGT
jgi:2-polyprenyl-6-methoxyphenol hydroxylase-like FAD-dependent oxidoreductase